jgi:vitamin B12 transporter
MTIRPIIATLFLAASTPALLQASGAEPLELKPNLVVTPSRAAEPLEQSLAAVSVITREDIEISVAEDLFELLRLQPGVDIVRTGGAGTQTSVFLRGSNSNHVLVLIDGVRVSSANTGAYAWEQLPLNQVERVEIVRGPRGSLYGSDAIGGVIHIFTRSNPDPHARATVGSYGTAEVEAGLGYRGEHSRISVNAGYRDVEGFSAQNPNGFSYHPDNDGLEAASLGIKGSTEAEYGNWRYSLLATDAQSEFDQGHSDARQTIASLGFSGDISPDWEYQLIAGYVHDDLFTDFEFFATDFRSQRYQLSWQNQLQFQSGGRLGFGADHYRENGRSAESWDQDRHNTGVFASYDRLMRRWHLQLGARMDDNSRYGSEFTGQVALGLDLSPAWQLSGSYGSAFREPNLSEQFSPGFGGLFAGNPDLDPESSASAEVGLRYRHDALGQFSATAYRTNVDALIAFNGEFFRAINIDRARLEGLELEYGAAYRGWRLKATATFQDAVDRATGEELLRRPGQKGSVTVDRRFSNGSWVGLEWFHSGQRSDFGGITLDSYDLLNLRAGWALSPAWRVEIRGDNLSDEIYEPAYGFNASGRAWYLSLAWLP